jgi:hypothetical protein
MKQRDFLKAQIEQFAKVLARIVSDFLRLKSSGNLSYHITTTNQKIKTQLDIDIDEILVFDEKALKDYLEIKKTAPELLEILSDYLTEIGKLKLTDNPADAERYLRKSVSLLSVADDFSKAVSLKRIHQKEIIEYLLQTLK